MNSGRKRWLVALLATPLLLGGGLWGWRQQVVAKRAEVSRQQLESGLAANDFLAARGALAGLADPARRQEAERMIRMAELRHAVAVGDVALIRVALGRDGALWMEPEWIERAELELARDALRRDELPRFWGYLEDWKEKAGLPGRWLMLEVDELLARGLTAEAMERLESAELSGADEAMRQARLALLHAGRPWEAAEFIERGLAADPRNAELLSFRAQLQESAGRLEDARLDYVAAVLAEPKNPLHRDMLAGFYLRTGDPAAAAETWRDAALESGLGVYGFKAWFASRMVGQPLSGPLPETRQESWQAVLSALAGVPADAFLSPALASALEPTEDAAARPEAIWLAVLEALRAGEDERALELLDGDFPRAADDYLPGLADRLRAHLSVRAGEDGRGAAAMQLAEIPDEEAHPLLREFHEWLTDGSDELPASATFREWFARPQAAVAVLFASGWPGAAVTLGGGAALEPDPAMPSWFAYGYARSLEISAGPGVALEWIGRLSAPDDATLLMQGELTAREGRLDEGLEILRGLANSTGPHASRAAWTLAMVELESGATDRARDQVQAHPELAASPAGREILARAALVDDDRESALRIYRELGEESADAMIFLSKEAFAAGDFAEAREWTLRLARQFPDQPQFRNNLLQIDEAERAAAP